MKAEQRISASVALLKVFIEPWIISGSTTAAFRTTAIEGYLNF